MINQINHKCILPQIFFEKYVYWKEMRKWFERERENWQQSQKQVQLLQWQCPLSPPRQFPIFSIASILLHIYSLFPYTVRIFSISNNCSRFRSPTRKSSFPLPPPTSSTFSCWIPFQFFPLNLCFTVNNIFFQVSLIVKLNNGFWLFTLISCTSPSQFFLFLSF